MAGSPNFVAGLMEAVKRSVINRIIGLVVLVVLAGAVAGVKFAMNGMHAKANDNAVQPVSAPARTNASASVAPNAPVVNAAASASGGVPVSVASKANGNSAAVATAKPGKAGSPAQSASSEGVGAPVVTAVPQSSQAPGSNLAHLDDHLTYQYNALGRRDPFQSLVDGQFVGADVGGDAPPDPGGIKVVGIVWGATDQFALVEDVRGNSFVLRKGDKVQNGYVEGLKRDGVIVNITAEGQSQTVVIPLVRKGDQNAR